MKQNYVLSFPSKCYTHLFTLGIWLKSQPILLIAALITCLTCLIIPIDYTYLGYIDFKTLSCLFTTLAVVAAFKHIYVFAFKLLCA